jgi:hypothetical protein
MDQALRLLTTDCAWSAERNDPPCSGRTSRNPHDSPHISDRPENVREEGLFLQQL